MLRPSYTDLLEKISNGKDGADVVGSRYTIVIAVAKRARQLVDHAAPLIDQVKVDKPVSIAVNELYEGKIRMIEREEKPEEEMEAGDNAQEEAQAEASAHPETAQQTTEEDEP